MATLKKGFWLLPFFAGLAFVFAASLKQKLLWFLFYLSAVCILTVLVYRWRRWTALDVTRSFNTDKTIMEAGARLMVILQVRVFSLLPWPWLEIEDSLPQSLKGHSQRQPRGSLAWARKGDVQSTTYWIPHIPRGIHIWNSMSVNSGDPLGFVGFQGRLRRPAKIVVYPRTISLPVPQFFPRRVEGAVMPRKAFNVSQTELVGIRDYQPGDRLGLIDWKATAKNNRLLSREYEPLLMSFSLVVLDCSVNSWNRGYDTAFEEAVTVAASLVKAAVAANIPTRFQSNYSKQPGQITVTSREEYYRLLGHFAAVEADGRGSLAPLLFKELFLRENNVVLVSSNQGSQLRSILHQLSLRGNSVTAILVGDGSQGTNTPLKKVGFYTELQIKKAEDLIPATAGRGAV